MAIWLMSVPRVAM